MKISSITIIDNDFAEAQIQTPAGTLVLKAELIPGCPAHIGSAKWAGSENDALDYYLANQSEVNKLLASAVEVAT